MSITLGRLEDIIDVSGAAPRIEALLPIGVRHRQLRVRTLILGMQLTLADRRPAHLTEVHAALISLPEADQVRLGVTEDWKTGPHQLTYRQAERTFGLVAGALSKDEPDGAPSEILVRTGNDLLEASIPAQYKNASRALAVDWTDVESFARPPRHGTTECADPEASWGHRNSNLPGPKGDMFFGYYHSAATMTADEHGTAVPELARRMILTSCELDPVRALVPVLTRMPAAGIDLGDILADSGYAHRDATPEQVTAHDTQAAELSRHKLGRISADDADGYHRVMCPAAMGKIRCPLRPQSMTRDRGRPEILAPPQHPPACCTQQTITVPPDVAAKTRQKHDYPSPAHRRSYTRRTGSERTFATLKDPATSNISRGWCRLMGLTPPYLWLACLLAVRNQRILGAWNARQAENTRRAAAGLPPKTRRRRRKTLTSLAAAPP